MARRRRTSLLGDLLELVALLPWWLGVLLAGLSYWLLHRVATEPQSLAALPGQMGSFAVQTAAKTVASFAQYGVPLLCLGGAGLSAWRRRQRRSLVADIAQSRASAALDAMTWRDFERLVGDGFRLQGYRVAETGGGGPDGGVDLVLKKGSEKFVVQCKQWRALKVGVTVVRELYGVMAARGAAGGFVVTSGRFTGDAVEFARGRNIELIDGPRLHALLRRAQTPQTVGASAEPGADNAEEPRLNAVPSCPVCARAMVKRTARRGAHAGSEFWGCPGYPDCKGTRAIG